MRVSGAVEGLIDDAVLRRLLAGLGHEVGAIHARGGKSEVLKKLGGYNAAAHRMPWVVLLDLDRDAACAAELVQSLLPSPAQHMRLRIAVRQVEAWLLADRARISRFLRVSQAHVPRSPDALPDAKAALVDLARRSTSRRIRQEMVPTPGSGRRVGVAYTARIIEFVDTAWMPEDAERHSDSLTRCMRRLREL